MSSYQLVSLGINVHGLHKLWNPTFPDGEIGGKFGEHGEHGQDGKHQPGDLKYSIYDSKHSIYD